jgi:DNA invertase Pin-like site-specific DNA recombinase
VNREKALKHWDKWRDYIASGGKSSWPRDGFESYLDRIEELEQKLLRRNNEEN